MTISNSTPVMMAAQAYVTQCITLDSKGFNDALADDVSGLHIRMIKKIQTDPFAVTGKKNVFESYQKYLFEDTRDSNLLKVSYEVSGLSAVIKYTAIEDKKEGDVWRKYQIDCKTQLDFKQDGDTLKIVTIWERTAKNPV